MTLLLAYDYDFCYLFAILLDVSTKKERYWLFLTGFNMKNVLELYLLFYRHGN